MTTVPVHDIDLVVTLTPLTALPHDPTVRLSAGRFARATLTPEGAAAVELTWADGAAHASAHGDGADWLLQRLPRLLGCSDDVRGFAPTAQPLRDVWRHHRGDRIARTGTLWHDLAWFIVQQRGQTPPGRSAGSRGTSTAPPARP
ncbi:hypothetical protein BH24ACT10_BH24ACT10_11640 [soil metagenome]